MNLKQIIDYIIIALCSAFAVFLKTTYFPNGLQLWIMPAAGAIILYILLHLFLRVPSYFYIWRLMCYREAVIEGDWVERVKKKGVRYYTFFSIIYDWRKDSYCVSGRARTSLGEDHAHWDSMYVKFIPDQLILLYLHVSKQPTKNEIYGFTKLSFYRPSSGRIDEGEGSFTDIDEEPVRGEFKFHRLTKRIIKDIIGKKKKRLNKDEIKKLIKAFDAEESAPK